MVGSAALVGRVERRHSSTGAIGAVSPPDPIRIGVAGMPKICSHWSGKKVTTIAQLVLADRDLPRHDLADLRSRWRRTLRRSQPDLILVLDLTVGTQVNKRSSSTGSLVPFSYDRSATERLRREERRCHGRT